MKYVMKPEIIDYIKKNRKNRQLAQMLGVTEGYISQIVNKHKTKITKLMAYALTKAISSDLEINDVFDIF